MSDEQGFPVNDAVRGPSAAPLAAAMLAVFAATAGSSVLIPVLPFFFEQVQSASRLSAEWHVSLLTSLYMFAAFLFAPLWGRWSDRFGRRTVLVAGLAGQAATAALLGIDLTLEYIYAVRMLNGIFAASVFPVAQAYAAERDAQDRRRWFAWIGTAALLGFLAGPLLGGVVKIAALPGGVPVSPWLAGPAVASAVLAAVALLASLAVGRARSGGVTSAAPASAPVASEPVSWSKLLPWIGSVVMLGVGVFEVSISLQAKEVMALSAFDIGILFAECSVVMIIAQFLAFSRSLRDVPRERVFATAMLLMAASVAAMPFTRELLALMLWIALFSGSAGLLLPLAAYWLSSESSSGQGYSMGKLYSYSNLGQAAGSLMSGPLFGMAAFAPFLIAAAVLGATAAGVGRRNRA